MFKMNKIKNEGRSDGQILYGDSVNECELWKCRSCGWGEIINSAADATNTTSELFTTQTIQTKFKKFKPAFVGGWPVRACGRFFFVNSPGVWSKSHYADQLNHSGIFRLKTVSRPIRCLDFKSGGIQFAPVSQKNVFFRALPEKGGGRPLPEFLDPFFNTIITHIIVVIIVT